MATLCAEIFGSRRLAGRAPGPLVKHPAPRGSIAGDGPLAASARRLPAGEADAVPADYVGRHPREWAKFKNVLENTLGTTISEHDTPLPMVELRLGRPHS